MKHTKDPCVGADWRLFSRLAPALTLPWHRQAGWDVSQTSLPSTDGSTLAAKKTSTILPNGLLDSNKGTAHWESVSSKLLTYTTTSEVRPMCILVPGGHGTRVFYNSMPCGTFWNGLHTRPSTPHWNSDTADQGPGLGTHTLAELYGHFLRTAGKGNRESGAWTTRKSIFLNKNLRILSVPKGHLAKFCVIFHSTETSRWPFLDRAHTTSQSSACHCWTTLNARNICLFESNLPHPPGPTCASWSPFTPPWWLSRRLKSQGTLGQFNGHWLAVRKHKFESTNCQRNRFTSLSHQMLICKAGIVTPVPSISEHGSDIHCEVVHVGKGEHFGDFLVVIRSIPHH